MFQTRLHKITSSKVKYKLKEQIILEFFHAKGKRLQFSVLKSRRKEIKINLMAIRIALLFSM